MKTKESSNMGAVIVLGILIGFAMFFVYKQIQLKHKNEPEIKIIKEEVVLKSDTKLESLKIEGVDLVVRGNIIE